MLLIATLACGGGDLSARPDAGSTRGGGPGRDTDTLLADTWCEEIDEAKRCTLWGPPFAALLVRPDLFDGKRVRVIGFVNFEFEGNAIYGSREDWEHSIHRNGLWVDPPASLQSDSGPPPARPNQQYVIAEGTFNARHTGHLGMWGGALENLTRLDPWGRVAVLPGPPR